MKKKIFKNQTAEEKYLGLVKDKNGKYQKDPHPTQATGSAALPYLDYDYINKLSKEEKEWLYKFNGEYYMDIKKGKTLHPKDMWVRLYSNNNARRRCYNLTSGVPIPTNPKFSTPSPEDALIEVIDLVNHKKIK